MDIKEFLKFNWIKLVITLLLGIAGAVLVTLNMCFGPQGLLACFPNVFLKVAYVVLCPFMILQEVVNGSHLIFLFTSVLFFILQICYLYIISCIVHRIFRKNPISPMAPIVK